MHRTLIILLTLLSTTICAQNDIKFTASAKKVVAIGEQFRLTYELNAKGSNFKPPDLKNFNILSGPNASKFRQQQFINGKMTKSFSYTYSYILQATKQGKFTISHAEITANKKKHKSNPVNIEVVRGTAPKSAQQTTTPATTTTVPADSKDLFVKVTVNKKNVYQGEHIIATIKIYTRLNLAGFNEIKFPSFNGFWTQDIETPDQISLQRENVNGQIYNVGVFRKTILFPQRSGELTIEPFEIECVIRQKIKPRSYFFSSYQTIKKKVKSSPIKIHVKPLPANKPEYFKAAVGNFKMQATIDKQDVKANDAITLKVKISGNGNLKLIEPLKIDFPPDFETYDPKIINNLKNTTSGVTGSKTFEYLIIPRHAGNFRIPPIVFSFFAPKTKQYKTITSDEFKIHVEKADEGEATTIITGLSKEDLKFIGSDIHFIKTNNFNLLKKGKHLFGSLMFYLSYLIALIIFFVIFILLRKKIKQNANLMLVKNRRAKKVSKKRLKAALSYLKQKNNEQFYNEVLRAFWGYLSDKLSIPVSELSKDSAANTLKNYNIDNALITQFMNVIDTCEYARYAPLTEASQMDNLYSQAINTIRNLEQKLR